jgi:histidinol phosphatase-like PHP family hydrolase
MSKGSFEFWKLHNIKNLSRIENLINSNKSHYLVDLHMHSDCSADGTQTVREIIERSIEKGFTIISITDHDSVEAYKEIEDLIREYELLGRDIPIIIPGLEYTVNFKEYGDMCHILKYGINPYDSAIVDSINENNKAFWNRAHTQFKRIKENPTLSYYSTEFDFDFNINEYEDYLGGCKVSIPEYPSLINYIHKKLEPFCIRLGDIVKRIEQDLEMDKCKVRADKKRSAINRFKEKYSNLLDEYNYPSRLLSPLFATVGIDDEDFPDFPSSGSLSVRNYNQLHINNLPKEGITVFAHPNGKSLELINECLHIGGKLSALELNASNRHANAADIKKKARELDLFITRGSDNHGKHYKTFDNMDFYMTPKQDLLMLLNALKEYNEIKK